MSTRTEKVHILITGTDLSGPALASVKKGLALIAAAYVTLTGVGKVFDELSEATQVAARIQVLNRVFLMTGQQAGYAKTELTGAKTAVMALGIAEKEALQISQRFVQAQLDLADATKIARAAQDLAVIAGTDSSAAALKLTEAIVEGQPVLLKQFGIMVNLNDVYGAQAKALGKTRDELTKTEKRTAFLNKILEEARTVAGAYESAMKDVGKRLTSLPRHLQTAQNAVGKHFLPVMGLAIDSAEKLLKSITRAFTPDLTLLIKARAKMEQSSASTLKLADRYDKLTEKTKLTNAEQEELNRILGIFENKNPGIITAWNDQGVAIEANTKKLRANLEAEQGVLALKMKDELRELGEAYENNRIALANSLDLLRNSQIIEGDNIDLQKAQAAGLKTVAENLITLREQHKAYVSEASLGLPNLIEGTDRYRLALSLLPPELVKQIEAHQEAQNAAVETARLGRETVAATVESIGGLYTQLSSFTTAYRQLTDEEWAEMAETGEEYSNTVRDAHGRLVKHVIKGQHDMAKGASKSAKEMEAAYTGSFAKMSGEWGQFAGDFGSALKNVENLTNETWSAMASAFKNLFLDSIFDELTPGGKFVKNFLKSFKFWDVAANDRALIEEGRRGMSFILQGMQERSSQFVPALGGSLAFAGGGGGVAQSSQVTQITIENITVNGGVDGIGNLVKEIESVATMGRSNIVIDTDNLTGSAPIVLE